jgi:protease I
MQKQNLDGLRIAILVADDFEQVELTSPRQALEQAGAKTTIVSSKAGQVTGMQHDEKKDKFTVDLTFDQADPGDFDGVLLPGGALNADFLRVEPKAQEFVRQIDKNSKPIAVICHAPWLLVSAGCVRGRTLTSYHTIQDDVRNAGGNWVDQEVARDHNWVSSRSPQDLQAFDPAMVELFAEYKNRKPQDILSA